MDNKESDKMLNNKSLSKSDNDKDSINVDGGWGWVVCFSGFLCNVISFGIFMTFGIFLEPLMEHYKASHSSISMVGSFMSGTFMMSMAITSFFVNQYGCRIVGTLGGIATAIFLGLSSFCQNLISLGICYGVLCGFGFGMVYISLIVACGFYFKKRLALAQGIMAVGASIGCMIFPPLATYIISLHGWQNCLRIFAILHLVCALCSLSYRPVTNQKEVNEEPTLLNSKMNQHYQPEGAHLNLTKQLISLKTNDDVKANERIAETTKLMSTSVVTFIKKTMFHSPLRRPEFTLLCIANLFGDFTQYLPYIYLPDMMGLVGISLSDASFTIALMGFSNLIGRIASGVVLDTSYINSFAFICMSFLSSGICVIAFPFCLSYTSYLIVELCYGCCVASYIVAMPILLIDMFGIEYLATTFGLLQLFRGIGCLIGPMVCGIMYDSTKSYVAPFVMAGLMFIFGGFLTSVGWGIKRKESKKKTDDTKNVEMNTDATIA